MDQAAKVFGVGFHKTGTTSLGVGLEMLGYRVCGPVGKWDPDIAENVMVLALAATAEYDAFQDNPWPLLYREMDERFPGSKFILTIRPTEGWVASVVNFFGTEETPMRRWIYGDGAGCPVGNEEVWAARYDAHNREVIAYFADRPGDLLVMRLIEGEGWEALCPFLGHEPPADEFPHRNKAGRGPLAAAVRRLKRVLR